MGCFDGGVRKKTAPIRDLAPVDNLLKPVDNALRKWSTDPSGLGVVVEMHEQGIKPQTGLMNSPHAQPSLGNGKNVRLLVVG
jgi:hypothetical protein